MNCKCSWVVGVLALIALVFAYADATKFKWVIVVSALLILLHSLMCKMHANCGQMESKGVMTKKKRR